MNYNPFEKPFASGEYNKQTEVFYLDKNLEANHIYYIMIYSGPYSYGPALLDFRGGEDFTTSVIAVKNASDDVYIYGLSCEVNSNTISPSNINVSFDGEEYTMYVYQLI